MSGLTVRDRAKSLVITVATGMTAKTVAACLGVTPATASSTLARLYWDGLVDRHKGPRAATGGEPPYLYTIRGWTPYVRPREASVQD